MASRSIRFTKAEMDAIASCANRAAEVQKFGGMQPGNAKLSAAVEERHLRSLLAKMQDASKPTENKLRVTPQDFAETLQDVMGDRVVVYDHASTWIKLYSILKSEPFQDLTAVRELGESVLKWATSPMSILTLATKGSEWLAVHRARKVAAPAPAPARKTMWDEEPED